MLGDSEKEQLDELGYLLLEDVISAYEADEMRALSLELAEQDQQMERDYTYLEDAVRVWNLVDKGEVFESGTGRGRIIRIWHGSGCWGFSRGLF